MKNPAIFFGAIVVAVISALIAVYYAIPGPYHVLTTHDYTSSHPTHVLLFAGITVVCILAALVTRPKKSAA
jgi:hypothetical protein